MAVTRINRPLTVCRGFAIATFDCRATSFSHINFGVPILDPYSPEQGGMLTRWPMVGGFGHFWRSAED